MQLTAWQKLRTRTYLAAIGAMRRMTLGARVMMVDEKRVYLIRHSYLPGWQFPGGGVEPGETAEQAGAREMLEETGYRANGPMELAGLFLNANMVTNRDHVALFVCRDLRRDYVFKANMEIIEFGWFPLDALPDGVTPAVRLRLAEVFEGAPRSALWGLG